MKNTRLVGTFAAVLLLIGGLNWGLIGLFRWDLIASIFGDMSPLTRIIYVLIGLAAVYDITLWIKAKSR